MSALEKHARRELELAGLFDKEADYGGALGRAVLELIRTFSSQGHSGGSAHMTLDLFERLARFKTLSPVSTSPAEWMEVGPDVWQSTRDSSLFSSDGGKTHYSIDDPDRVVVKTGEAP